jgi:hypothetical protein
MGPVRLTPTRMVCDHGARAGSIAPDDPTRGSAPRAAASRSDAEGRRTDELLAAGAFSRRGPR